MTTAERQIWIATFAAAYVAKVDSMRRGHVELCEDIAASAANVASEALAALRDTQRGNIRLSLATERDLERVLKDEGEP
jgi:streptogramin lyase